MADYKIKLGIDFDDGELKNIKKQLTNLTDNTHRIRIDIDNSRLLKQIDHAKKELKELNSTKGNQPSLTVNTQSLEKSLSRVADVIDEVRKSLGSIDDKSGMQSLVASVNQIATALGRAEDESDNLVKSLSALSKKDFSFNFNVKTGNTNPVKAMTDYGREARKNSIPALEEQVAYLHKLFGGWEKADAELKKYLLKSKQLKGLNEYTRIQDDIGNASSLSKQMDALQDYIEYTKKIASEKGIDLSGFNAKFSKSAKDIVDDTIKIQTGAKQTEEELDKLENKLKNVFGVGIDAESLSVSLTPIIEDLREIRETIQELSKGFSLNGLTQSFDRLSGSIENLLKNAEKVKGVLNSGVSSVGVDTGSVSGVKIKAEDIVPDSSEVVQAAQQVGTKIGDTIEQSVKQSINVDDVIDQEVLGLMETFSIAGDKGSNAFKEIRQALIECRSELQRLKTLNPSNDEEAFDTSGAFNKVSDAIANQIREVNSLGDEYIKLAKYIDNIEDVELAKYMTNFNDPKKGNKVRVPDFIKQEQGDDYRSTRGQLGIAFNTEKGISFASFIEDLNHELGIAIDLTNGEEKAYEELVDKLRLGREQLESQKKSQNYLQANASTDEILAQNYINKNEIRDVAESSIDYINATEAAEKAFAQASTQSANTVSQNEERKQQAYQETADVYEDVARRTQQANKLISDSAQNAINNVSSRSIDRAYRVSEDDSIRFNNEMERLVSQWTNGKGELTDIKIDTASVYDSDTDRHIEEITRAQVTYNNELGETIKKTIAWRQIGTEVKVVDGKEVPSPLMGFVEVSSQYSKSLGKTKVQTDKFVKQQKQSVSDLTNQINQLNRAATDQNANRPIKKPAHLDALESKYQEIISTIKKMGEASSSTFDEERNKVKTLISDYKSLRDELRNADNVSNKMKGTDFDSGLGIAKNDLEKFKAQAKDFPQITTTIEQLDNAIANVGDKSSLDAFNDQLRVARSELAKVKAETIATNRKEKVGIDVSSATSKIANIQRISPEIDGFKAKINGAEVSVESLLDDLSRVNTADDFSVVNRKLKAFTDAAESAGIAVKELNQSSSTSSLTKEVNQDINNFIKLQKQIEDTRFNIGKLEIAGGSTNQIAELKRELKELEDTYDKLMQAFMKKISVNADVVSFNDVVEKLDGGIETATKNAEYRLEQFRAKYEDTRNELAKSIKLDIELGNFDNEIDAMRVKFNSLSDANDELRRSYNATEDAYTAMMNVAKANTGDEVADRERLIQAEKEYATALEKTNNLIKQQARADKIANDAEKLADKKTALKLDMANYLKDNSRAAKEFGDEIRRLSSLLDNVNLDDIGVNKISRTFKNLTKKIKNAEKDGLTVFDRLKSKAKEYMTYLSAAEVFMWIEQGIREMFNTVKEIDTAMTGLYRVTDLTASQYDVLFNNMIDSAKEYGATLNDIINATTDWVRAGFEADTALGLAEVTTMYQHISDLDYDTAAENLITAYNGFKDELNGAFSGDQVAAVNYIADIFNELDKQNCPLVV